MFALKRAALDRLASRRAGAVRARAAFDDLGAVAGAALAAEPVRQRVHGDLLVDTVRRADVPFVLDVDPLAREALVRHVASPDAQQHA